MKFLRVIKPTSVSLGSMAALISQSFMCLQFCSLVYRRHLTFIFAIFLDDGWAIERDRQVCRSVSKAVKTDLGEVGFIRNDEKSIWEPCQRIDWLGLTWDSARGTIETVNRRCAKILGTIDSIVDSGFGISSRNLAYFCFTGQIISTSPVSGNTSRIMTRHCVLSTLSVQYWEEKIELDQYCIEELRFWRTNLNSLKVRDCFLSHKPQRFVHSDASSTGCGSVITLNEEHICHRLWEPSECSKSSTWKELAAIDFSLESFASVLEGSLVKWFTRSGKHKVRSAQASCQNFQFCAEHNIRLEVQWFPRTKNEKADYISHLIDFDFCRLCRNFFSV